MDIKGIILDMDGTMLDTEPLSFYGWEKAVNDIGLTLSQEFMFGCVGLPSAEICRNFLDHFGNDFDFVGFRERSQAHVKGVVEKSGVPLKPGLFELLDFIKEKNLKCAVATSTGRQRAMYLMDKVDISRYFDVIICGDSIKHGKPNPDIYLKTAEALGHSAEQCMAVEDSKNGILAAARANTYAVLIPDLIIPDNEMLSVATSKVESLFDVIELLK
ncbi:MAG: HAD-IA family hydrolase [Oscillospiraceae bacterium]